MGSRYINRELSIICRGNNKKPPSVLSSITVGLPPDATLDELTTFLLTECVGVRFLNENAQEAIYDDSIRADWFCKQDAHKLWKTVKDNSWLDYPYLCCCIRLNDLVRIEWTSVSNLAGYSVQSDLNTGEPKNTLFQLIKDKDRLLKKDDLYHAVPSQKPEDIISLLFKIHSSDDASVLNPQTTLHLSYCGEDSSGEGVTKHLYQQFWDHIDDPAYGLLRSEDHSDCLIPNRHTSFSTLCKYQILGRIIITSMRHDVYPTRLHPICFGFLPETEHQLENWIQSSFPAWVSVFPADYQTWRQVPLDKRQLYESEFHLDRIMDEYELTESNYPYYRMQVYKELLFRHRDLSIQAIRRGMESTLNDTTLQLCKVTTSYQEWKKLNVLQAEDVWNRMELCRDNDNSIHTDMIFHYLKDSIYAMSTQELIQFHVFVTGNYSDRRKIQIYVDHERDEQALPRAYTCTPSLTFFRKYTDQKDLMSDLCRISAELYMTLQ